MLRRRWSDLATWRITQEHGLITGREKKFSTVSEVKNDVKLI
jgi:hypothetical protein